jgi:hypothetical protein
MSVALMPWTSHERIQTTDFVNFYAAATIVREGHGAQLYRRETQDPVLKSILGRSVTDYFLHPPFEAVALIPLSFLTIERAFVVWTLANLALLGLLPLLFAKCVSFVDRRLYLGLLGFVFAPVMTGLALGQDSILVLFIITAAYLLYAKGRDFSSGLVLALATVKFQYIVILALLLFFSRKLRLIGGLMAGCGFLALASALVTGPAALVEYFRFVFTYNLHGGYGSIRPALMVNWRGLFAGMGWTSHTQAYSAVGSVLLLILGIACSRSVRAVENPDLAFSLFVAIALAASPYAHFQDATILLLPIFLAMDSVLSGRTGGTEGKVIAASCVLMFLSPIILLLTGGHYWWNSRIYLVFPAIVLFIAALAIELYPRGAVLPV